MEKNFDLESHILGTLYGNCIGDAIGLLTEFMVKSEAEKYYKKLAKKGLEYKHKVPDMHRSRWETGDWTDDSDQMILIMDSLLDKRKIDVQDYGERLINWSKHGFTELGDNGGMGIGTTTVRVLYHKLYSKDPHGAAKDVWERSGCNAAPNGGVMRTSLLGIYQYNDIESVISNTKDICKVTHADPRCQASCVAVTSAIALMLQEDPSVYDKKKKKLNVDALINECYKKAKCVFDEQEENYDKQCEELYWYLNVKQIKDLNLEEHGKIGYTYKTLGAGFWALKQNDFRKALTEVAMEAGDADTNGAVAGALLGCKLGLQGLPGKWLEGLKHKEWLDKRIFRFLHSFLPDLEIKCIKYDQDWLNSAGKQNDQTNKKMAHLESRILGTLYGNCIGDAIGLLTEFMVKKEAERCYKTYLSSGGLEYKQKVEDMHRRCWDFGDWTDDSDQMILILDMLLEKKKVDKVRYGEMLINWARNGFKELGDFGGNGLGATTHHVLHHKKFGKDPHIAAQDIWEKSGYFVAPNGAVMRTSILGLYQYEDLQKVKQNTLEICKVTHADPRCQASCIAVTYAIAIMLQRQARHLKNGEFDVDTIIADSLEEAKSAFNSKDKSYSEYCKELTFHMNAKNLTDLKLDEHGKIGYTYKSLGAGFWALRQENFKQALTDITMEAGDADTNGAVAGALLGCKLGLDGLPRNWLEELKFKQWLDNRIERFLKFAFPQMDIKLLSLPSQPQNAKSSHQHHDKTDQVDW